MIYYKIYGVEKRLYFLPNNSEKHFEKFKL